MPNPTLAEKAADCLRKIRETNPLIHNITNYVVMNVTANALLAAGASPVMAHAEEEVEEMAALSGALVLNIGTLSRPWIASMLKAGKRANDLKIPVLLDPVGSGATSLRTETARRLIDELSIQVIRGNASEILSLAGTGSEVTTKGVDSVHSVDQAAETARQLARELNTTLAITGAVDLVTDGQQVCRVLNGVEMMGRITGSGCTASALLGAFLAVSPQPLEAAAGGLAYFGLAGEKAALSASGPGSFQTAILDALYLISEEELRSGARILMD